MKLPKKAQRCKTVIDKLVTHLEFYMGHTKEFKDLVKNDVQYLEEYLNEISEDHKLHNIKFATKLKALWKKELKEKDNEIKQLKKELT